MKSNTLNFERIPHFLHIPETGGTTLKLCIYAQYTADTCYELEEGRLVDGITATLLAFIKSRTLRFLPRRYEHLERYESRAVVGHFSFGIHPYVNRLWTYITLLREPMDRVVSLYHIWRDRNTPLHEIVSSGISIEDFVLYLSCREADNDQTRRISGLEPEFGACSTSTLDKAKDNLRRYFSVVGVTECFDETVILIKRTLGWADAPYYLPELVNKERPAIASLPQKRIDIILERNELDTQLHEFAKELLYERIANQGPDFNSEVRRFKALNAEYIAKRGLPSW